MTTRRHIEQVLVDTGLGIDGPKHAADLGHPESFSFDDRATVSSWGKMGRPGFTNAEWRFAVIAEQNEWPTESFVLEFAFPELWSHTPADGWGLFYEVNLEGTGNGAWLGDDDRPQANPFESSRGKARFLPVDPFDGVADRFSARWMVDAIMLHGWANKKMRMPFGHNGELATMAIRINPASLIAPARLPKVLAGVGLDYYAGKENNNRAPGPGIARHKHITTEWQTFSWLTPSPGVPWTRPAVAQWVDQYGLPPASAFSFVDSQLGELPPPPVDPTPELPTPPVEVPFGTANEALAELLVELRTNHAEIMARLDNLEHQSTQPQKWTLSTPPIGALTLTDLTITKDTPQ